MARASRATRLASPEPARAEPRAGLRRAPSRLAPSPEPARAEPSANTPPWKYKTLAPASASGGRDFEDRDAAKCPVRQQYVVGEWLLTHELLKQRPLNVKVTAGIDRHLTQHGLDGLSLLLAHARQDHIGPAEAASLNPDDILTARRRRAASAR
jgi:hypothetical protein